MAAISKWISIGVAILVLAGALLCCRVYIYYANRDPRPQTLYCWLVFGPNATPRVLVRCDDNAISVDANANGVFEPNERFARIADCKDVRIVSATREASYTLANVAYQRVNQPPWALLRFQLDIQGRRRYRQLGEARMATTPSDGVEVPFDGALVIREPFQDYFRSPVNPPAPTSLRRSGPPNVLQVDAGTFTTESGATVCPNVGREWAFPPGVYPVVDIQFPPRKPGDPEVRKRYPLDGFC